MKVAFLMMLIGLMGGCSSRSDEFDHADYLARISRVLAVDIQTDELSIPPRLQPKSRMGSETRIGLTEALTLGPCGLVPLIAERNSALGRQKAASQTLLYEWAIWDGLVHCAETSAGTADWLSGAITQKADDRSVALWNLLMASDTADALYSTLDSGDQTVDAAWQRYVAAFTEFRRVSLAAMQGNHSPTAADRTAFEKSIQSLESTRMHGQLRRRLFSMGHLLEHANAMQAVAIEANTLCPMGTPTEQGRRAQGLVTSYFATQVQGALAATERQHRELLALWAPLSESLELPDAPNAQLDFILQVPAGTLDTYQTAVRTHVRQWQEVLARCQLAPTLATTNTKD